MRPWTCFALACLFAGIMAGCLQPPGPPGPDATSGSQTTSAPMPAEPIEVFGSLREHEAGWLVDAQAHHVGNATLGYVQSYCEGTAWFAQLSGPPGENLTYRDPNAFQLGCPGFTNGRFEPGTWQNWTADPDCDLYYVCDNQWDGRIWPGGHTDDGPGEPAPPGNYTWRFIFPYFDHPGYTDDRYHNPQGRHTIEVVFTVEVA